MDLFGQFPSRRDDQGAKTPPRPRHEALENGEGERGRFARAGLGEPHDVLSLEYEWNALQLNWGGSLIAKGTNAGFYLRVKLKQFETHQNSCFLCFTVLTP
jgi:hypothetical protein